MSDSKESKYKRYAIGIDLGTTYSCVAVLRNSATGVEVIANDLGNRTMPSYVAFTQSERLVGEAAKNQSAMNPANTIFDAKRLIGRVFNDKIVQDDMKLWPFKVVDDGQNQPQVEVQYMGETKRFYPQQISAMVLSKMKETAERFLGMPVRDAVVTVPAYFNNQQRDATSDAAVIAGLKPLRILNEPTAGAMAYGLDMKRSGKSTNKEQNVLIFDLGGGTFDVSLLCVDSGVYEVKAVGGDTHLGGEDFDGRLVQHFAKEFKNKYKKDLTKNDRALRRLRTACERAKRQLSSSTVATIEIDSLMEGQDFATSITRARFEEINLDYFQACMKPVEQVLQDAKLSKGDIDEVVLIGGSTRIPKIQQMVRDYFNKEPCKSVNVDEAVAVGAALQAAILTGQGDTKEATEGALIIDVAPLSLGIETAGGVMTKLIERNTQVPCHKSQVFSTYQDGQEAVVIQIFEGERAMTRDNKRLGKFELSGIPPAPRGVPKIKVSFDLDCNGILKVTAVDEGTKNSKNIEVKKDTGKLSKEQIDEMVRQAAAFKDEDEKAIKRTDAMYKLEAYTYSLRDTLKAIAEKKLTDKVGGADVCRQLQEQVDATIAWLPVATSANVALGEIEQRQNQLEQAATPIVSKMYADAGPSSDSSQNASASPSQPSASSGPRVEEVD